jgi:hypothetical protein
MNKSGLYKYIATLIISVAICVGLVWWIIITGGGKDDAYLFVAEVVGISLCVNIAASVVIMIFFERRDFRAKYEREYKATHKIALAVNRFLRVIPDGKRLIDGTITVIQLKNQLNELDLSTPNTLDHWVRSQSATHEYIHPGWVELWRLKVPEFYRKMEHLRDVLHNDISHHLTDEIDSLLHENKIHDYSVSVDVKNPNAKIASKNMKIAIELLPLDETEKLINAIKIKYDVSIFAPLKHNSDSR